MASQRQRIACRGTPQGVVYFSTPHLWNFTGNSLLRRLESPGNNAIDYDDDIAITASGICPQTLPNKLNLVLSIVLDQSGLFGLSINLSKTDTILIIRRYKLPPQYKWDQAHAGPIKSSSTKKICRSELTLNCKVRHLCMKLTYTT